MMYRMFIIIGMNDRCINDEKRETTHIETYCKKETCWTVVKKVEYHVSDELSKILVGINN